MTHKDLKPAELEVFVRDGELKEVVVVRQIPDHVFPKLKALLNEIGG
tara:strand:+ start:427 stop:567 length:141 start_codon:yes stop_codon:yes gene_type:complete